MQDARSYLEDTRSATAGLFNLLNQYGWEKMRKLVDLMNSKTKSELDVHKANFSSNDIAREVIAGSILQIAYVAIAKYGSPPAKSPNVITFESQINRLIKAHPKATRWKKKTAFELPVKFCIGRDLDHLPLGMVVYAGRNQYNHFYEGGRLNVENEIVFNHLHQLHPDPTTGISFDLRPNQLFSYSVLAALGWIDKSGELGYVAYERDMCDIFKVVLK